MKKYSKSFVFKINGRGVVIANYFNSYNYGFSHTSRLSVDGRDLSENVVGYINRTWECFNYQTSALGAVSKAIDSRKEAIKRAYKNSNGIQRVTKRHSEKLEAMYDSDALVCLLRKVGDALSGNGHNFQTVY